MPPRVREYVSGHVYRTKTGLYYDDRTGKRLTRRRGEASGKARERMKARYRDEDTGRLIFKNIRVTTDGRSKETGARKYDQEADVPVSYDPEINAELAEENARKHLDEDEPEFAHFNVSFLMEIAE